MDAQQRIAEVIEAYDGQGWHRTATEVDRLSGEWLAEQVRQVGLEPTLEPFTIDRIDIGESYVEANGERVEGVPLFDSTFSNADGVSGALGEPDSGAPIVLVDSDVGVPRLTEVRQMPGTEAIIVATRGFSEGLSLLNAPAFLEPFGPPAVQVDGPAGDRLLEHARGGGEVRVVSTAERSTAEAYNVTASVPGDTSLRPLGVNTPRSGWWEVAAERGGGLACWLEVMRSLVEAEPARPLFFSACSGHELGFLGTDRLLDAHPDLIECATWVHFGANIGSKSGTVGRLNSSNEALHDVASAVLDASVERPMQYRSDGSAGGEMLIVHRRGGRRHMSLTNDNAYFHMREDRFTNNVDVGVIEEFANAFSSIAQTLAEAED